MHHPTDRITHATAFVTPVVEHWLEREIAQCLLGRIQECVYTIKKTRRKEGRKEMFYLMTQQGFFYMHHPTDRISHTMAFVTSVVEHWLERTKERNVLFNDAERVLFIFTIPQTG